MQLENFVPIIAHPERNRSFRNSFKGFAPLSSFCLNTWYWPLVPLHSILTGASLMVIPRSRSIGLLSKSCSCMWRFETVPVISRSLSASVDLPWSIWAIIAKLRIKDCDSGGFIRFRDLPRRRDTVRPSTVW